MSRTQKPAKPDALTKAGKSASIELTESDLDKVAGGNKVKSADKQSDATLAFIKG